MHDNSDLLVLSLLVVAVEMVVRAGVGWRRRRRRAVVYRAYIAASDRARLRRGRL